MLPNTRGKPTTQKMVIQRKKIQYKKQKKRSKLNILYQYPQKDMRKYSISIFNSRPSCYWEIRKMPLKVNNNNSNKITIKSKELSQKVKQKDKEL